MRAYWIRVLASWLLLSAAGRIMKSAEAVLRAAQEATAIDAIEDSVEIGTEVPGADMITDYVDAKFS